MNKFFLIGALFLSLSSSALAAIKTLECNFNVGGKTYTLIHDLAIDKPSRNEISTVEDSYGFHVSSKWYYDYGKNNFNENLPFVEVSLNQIKEYQATSLLTFSGTPQYAPGIDTQVLVATAGNIVVICRAQDR